jgi:hypothetical protein
MIRTMTRPHQKVGRRLVWLPPKFLVLSVFALCLGVEYFSWTNFFADTAAYRFESGERFKFGSIAHVQSHALMIAIAYRSKVVRVFKLQSRVVREPDTSSIPFKEGTYIHRLNKRNEVGVRLCVRCVR